MRILAVLLCLCILAPAYAQMPPVPNLPYTNLEEAGFNRDSMNVLYDKIDNFEHGDFTGLVIIKDHKLVTEWHFNTYWRKQILDIRSAGKSITSLLLGVAMKEGLVQSLDQDIYSFFPQEKYPNIHEDYKKIKLSHVLDMASGLDADTDRSETPGHAVNWSGGEEWTQYILTIPLADKPGEKWVYADINAALVGAIIEETSGMSLRGFATEKVFKPLGIKQFFWFTNEANQTVAAGTLYLSTLDFAKLGVLVANEGKWADKQIVDAEYIQRLIDRRAFDLTDYWRLTDSYGMLWYKKSRTINGRTFDYSWASGRGGNQLIVLPNEDMVIALTSTAYGPRYGHSRAYEVLGHVLGAIK
ncbi:serine hydrolase [Roseivirga sp. E12]|uniref:serine hydrolase domain-containing protein n=1 Tax=Roseivirga sp. E12 TaxID=2819237 RepID=UPI001ABC348F|nr:serine hydrolase [Roseivirga sp. E12]MBO3698154.1 serine hydrolase [Roseivirga sp. E12]